MSDTPRTDELEYDGIGISNFGHQDLYYAYKFARQLERELNEANKRIKRLEEAGDALCENSNPSRWDSPAAAAQKIIDQSNWNKAKEAK